MDDDGPETRDHLAKAGTVTVGPERLFTPSAVSVARVGMSRFQRGGCR